VYLDDIFEANSTTKIKCNSIFSVNEEKKKKIIGHSIFSHFYLIFEESSRNLSQEKVKTISSEK
jgi:hypothetical protein